MTVVRNEFESGENNPQLRAAGAGCWPPPTTGTTTATSPIGARSDIENVDIERLQAFYRTYYQPDNAVLIVAGKFDPATTLALDREVLRPDPQARARAAAHLHREPVQDGERTVTVRRVGSAQFVGALFRTVPRRAPRLRSRSTALGEIMTIAPVGPPLPGAGRDQEGERRRGLERRRCATRATLIFWAQVPMGDSIDAGARRDARDARRPRATQPITEAEVDRVRTKALPSTSTTMLNDPQQLGVALSESIALGDWRLFFLQRDRWRALTAADVQRVGARVPQAREPARSGSSFPTPSPTARRTPPAVDVAAMVKDYKGDAAVAAGEAFDPTPANLEARTQRFTLPNGMKVALLPKKTRGETVRVQPAPALRATRRRCSATSRRPARWPRRC